MGRSSLWRAAPAHIPAAAADLRGIQAIAGALREGRGKGWIQAAALSGALLGEDPEAAAQALLFALREGAWPAQLAQAVAHAAALRIARFGTSNEFGDWDTAPHTFTY